jgi:hypothetical protein
LTANRPRHRFLFLVSSSKNAPSITQRKFQKEPFHSKRNGVPDNTVTIRINCIRDTWMFKILEDKNSKYPFQKNCRRKNTSP